MIVGSGWVVLFAEVVEIFCSEFFDLFPVGVIISFVFVSSVATFVVLLQVTVVQVVVEVFVEVILLLPPPPHHHPQPPQPPHHPQPPPHPHKLLVVVEKVADLFPIVRMASFVVE